MNPLKSNVQRAKRAMIFLQLVLVIQMITIVSNYFSTQFLEEYSYGRATQDEAISNAIQVLVIGVLRLGLFIGAIITFIQWFRRAYYNLHQRNEYLSLGEGWAAGGWFIPILNWFYPVKIMWEMTVETETLLVDAGLTEPKPVRKQLVAIWWSLWLGLNIVATIFSFASIDVGLTRQIELARTANYLNFVYIPLTIVAVAMIKKYSEMELLLAEMETEKPVNFTIGTGDLLDSAV